MSQQSQTFEYFNKNADNWNREAEHEVYSVIQDRHRAVKQVMTDYPVGSSLLDVGCGTGQLAIEASKMGWKATGIDFSPEMVDKAKQNNTATGGQADFMLGSIFSFNGSDVLYDVLSAQGFIEYISLSELDQLLEIAYRLLKTGGAVAIGSRNRLFNAASMNEFSDVERALGFNGHLMDEAIVFQTATSQQDALERLRSLDVSYEHPTHHPVTGIKVDTRFQFTPADLMGRMERHGFRVSAVYPVHYHAMPVSVLCDPEIDRLHRQIARFISEKRITVPNYVPYATSFLMRAEKK